MVEMSASIAQSQPRRTLVHLTLVVADAADRDEAVRETMRDGAGPPVGHEAEAVCRGWRGSVASARSSTSSKTWPIRPFLGSTPRSWRRSQSITARILRRGPESATSRAHGILDARIANSPRRAGRRRNALRVTAGSSLGRTASRCPIKQARRSTTSSTRRRRRRHGKETPVGTRRTGRGMRTAHAPWTACSRWSVRSTPPPVAGAGLGPHHEASSRCAR